MRTRHEATAVGDDETIEELLDGLNLVTEGQQDLRDSLHSKVLEDGVVQNM